MPYSLVDIRATIARSKTRKWPRRNASQIDTIVVHTSASDNQDPNKTAKAHIAPGPQNHISTKGCESIAYHDFITEEGIIYHCNDINAATWHCGIWNKRSIGVVMAFRGQDQHTDGTYAKPTDPQWNALKHHLVVLCLYAGILPERIVGHREVPGMVTILGKGSKRYKKTCPGLGVDLDALRHEVTLQLQRRLIAEGLLAGQPDGIFGPKSKAALKLFRQIVWQPL